MYVNKLIWHNYEISELECYADYSFNNGIFIRVNKGKMTETITLFPFEIMIKKPHKNSYYIGFLDKKQLNELMNKLAIETVVI